MMLHSTEIEKLLGNSCLNDEIDLLFDQQLNKHIIRLLSPQLSRQPFNILYDEDQIYENLIRPMECFICDLPYDTEASKVKKTLEALKCHDSRKSLCRKMLKRGDTVFSCFDCSFDDTCVVCIDCFHKGNHKNHNYRMFSSGAGGCCDCGDVEAWKSNYACTEHFDPEQKTISLTDFENFKSRQIQLKNDFDRVMKKIEKFPKELASRYFLLARKLINYAHLFITWNQDEMLPKIFEHYVPESSELSEIMSKNPKSKNFTTVLFNDEVHTYDQVIFTLVHVIKCTKITASMIAAIISKEGRSCVACDTQEICKKYAVEIAKNTTGHSGPLEVKTMHGSVIAHQAFATRTISFIQRMSTVCDSFRILTAAALFEPFEHINLFPGISASSTIVEDIMLSNSNIWKACRSLWNDLLVSTMFNDYCIKDTFSRLLTRNYNSLMKNYIEDDHEFDVSAMSLTVQIYTVPSLACMLIEEENALTTMSIVYSDSCIGALLKYRNTTFDLATIRSASRIISDMRLLLNIAPSNWTELYRENFLQSATIFIDFLDSLQGTDSIKREQGNHVEYDPEWESCMTLQQRLGPLITKYVEHIGLDEKALVACVTGAQKRLKGEKGFKNLVIREIYGHEVECISYDPSELPVSIHLALSRFVGALILKLMMRRPCESQPYDESLIIFTNTPEDENKQTMVQLMEHTLRTQVMIAQSRCGMWRRNGFSLVNQLLFYHSPLVREEMFDRDILILQECAATCDPNEYMIHLLNKFKLLQWANLDESNVPAMNEEQINLFQQLGDEFLHLLITIVSERYRIGLGEITESDAIKYEIIQILCTGPAARSDILAKLNIESELEITECIKQVATLRRSGATTTAFYELKPEFYDQYNPYFYHHQRRHQSNAMSAQLKKKKKLGEQLVCCPPPCPANLTPQFSNINELLKCDVLLSIIRTILHRTKNISKKYPANDLQVEKSLYLIGLGMHEQYKKPTSFDYLSIATSCGVFEALDNCKVNNGPNKDMIQWLVNKGIDICTKLEKEDEHIKISIKRAFLNKANVKIDEGLIVRKANSEAAALRREKIMAMMKLKQKKFMETVKDEVKNNEEVDESTDCCMICQKKDKLDLNEKTMIFLTYVQRSTVLSKSRGTRRIPFFRSAGLKQMPDTNFSTFFSDNSITFDTTFMPSDLFFGPCITSCGHMMHLDCWKEHSGFVKDRERARSRIHQDLEPLEVLCPYCSCISNTVLPIIPQLPTSEQDNLSSRIFNVIDERVTGDSLTNFIFTLKNAVETPESVKIPEKDIFGYNTSQKQERRKQNNYATLLKAKKINHLLEELNEKESLGLRDFIKIIREKHVKLMDCSKTLLESFISLNERIHMISLDLDKNTPSSHSKIFTMITWTVSYTLQTIERLARSSDASVLNDKLFQGHSPIKRLFFGSLIKYAVSSVITLKQDVCENLLVTKLRYLLVPQEHLSSYLSILDIDALELLVSLTILLQKLYCNITKDTMWQATASSSSTTSIASRFIQLEDDRYMEEHGWATYAYEHEYYKNTLQLVMILNLTQVIISLLDSNFDDTDDNEYIYDNLARPLPQDKLEEECSILENFISEIIIASGHPNSRIPKPSQKLLTQIKTKMLPFIRTCGLFYYYLYWKQSDSTDVIKATKNVDEEYANLMEYLCLASDFKGLLASQAARDLVKSWLKHSRVLSLIREHDIDKNTSTVERVENSKDFMDVDYVDGNDCCTDEVDYKGRGRSSLIPVRKKIESIEPKRKPAQGSLLMLPVKLVRQPHRVNRLIELPEAYSDLVERVANFSCPSIHDEESRTPAMCLICGAILCSQSYCCQRDLNDLVTDGNTTRGSMGDMGQVTHPSSSPSTSFAAYQRESQQLVGGCTYHSYECCGGQGIFLRIRTCQILMLSNKKKGCYMSAPYLDDHGECDFGLFRGCPLQLNKAKYESLQRKWLGNFVPERVHRSYLYNHGSNQWHLH